MALFKQILGGILLVVFLTLMAYKFQKSLMYEEDGILIMLLIIIVILLLLIVVRKIVYDP